MSLGGVGGDSVQNDVVELLVTAIKCLSLNDEDDGRPVINAVMRGLELTKPGEVRLAAAETLCNFAKCGDISNSQLKMIVDELLKRIEGKDLVVASKVCEAIYFIVQHFEDAGRCTFLPARLPNFIDYLSECADESDSDVGYWAYRALSKLVKTSNLDFASSHLRTLVRNIRDKLALSENSEQQADRFCIVRVIIRKLSSDSVTRDTLPDLLESIGEIALQALASCGSTVFVEAMDVMGEIANVMGEIAKAKKAETDNVTGGTADVRSEIAKARLESVLHKLYPYVKIGIQNLKDYEVCNTSLNVFWCMHRASSDQVLPYFDEIMDPLLKNLASTNLNPDIRPIIIVFIGDMAKAVNGHFRKHAEKSLKVMYQTVTECCKFDNGEEEVYRSNQARYSLFEAYSGILQGLNLKSSEPFDLWNILAPQFIEILQVVAKDPFRDKHVTMSALEALRIFADTLPPKWIQMLFKDHPFYVEFLDACLESDDEELTETALWTQEEIARVLAL